MNQPVPKRVLIIQDNATTNLLRQILGSTEYELLDTNSSEQAFDWLSSCKVDLAIVEVSLGGFDGIDFVRQVRTHPINSDMPILMLTYRVELNDKVSSFEAGADDYLIKPFQPQELIYRARLLVSRRAKTLEQNISHPARGRIIALFGTKGGVGRTTLGVNICVTLQRRAHMKVALFDADFFFGDIALHLNVSPNHTIMDLIPRIDQLDQELVDRVMAQHSSGVRVLLSPRNPEDVESIGPNHIENLLEFLVTQYDYVFVDCQTSYDERTLIFLEKADAILLVIKPEVGCVKNMAIFSELVVKLGLPFEQKIHIVLNRAGSKSGISPKEIERIFRRQIKFQVPSGGNAVVMSVNRGIPLSVENPNHPFSVQIAQIADYISKYIRPVEQINN